MINDKYCELSTERLTLGRFTADDIADVYSMVKEESLLKNCMMPYPYTKRTASKWITKQPADIEKNREYVWAVRRSEDRKLIGAIGLIINAGDNSAEIGFWLGKEFRNQKFGREMVKEIAKFAFETLELNKIWAKVFTDNYSSSYILDLNGFQPEGKLRKHVFQPYLKKYRDIILYGFINDDYRKRNPKQAECDSKN